jgi:hypothetical protein
MDLEPALKGAIRRVAQALHKYAQERGWRYASHADWGKGDYYIDIIANDEWGRIYVTFAAKAFSGMGELKRFESVQDYLESELADDPGLVEAISLVVKDQAQFDHEGRSSLGLGDVEVDEDFIEASMRQAGASSIIGTN